jgi:Family of unknown function (DUF6049)
MKAAVVALSAVLALTAPAAATAQAQPAPTGTLRMASQTSWVGLGQELDIRVNITTSAPATDVELAVSVYRQVGSRSEFLNTLKDRLRGSPLTSTATPLSELETDPAGAYLIRLPVQDPAQPIDRNRIRLRDEGVYPVRVELRETAGGRSIDRFVSHLVYGAPPKDDGVPLGFAWVLPISAPPSVRPDGTSPVADASSNRLAAMAQALEAHPDVPLTVLPTAETIEALNTSNREVDRSTVQQLSRALANRQVVGGTYVPVQPGAFETGAGQTEFAAQLDRAGDTLARLLSVRPDPRTWVSDERLNVAALDRLRAQQVDRIVLPENAFEPAGLPVTLAQPFELQAGSLRRPAAAAADLDLQTHFTRQPDEADDPVLRAHALLADLAVLYFDNPGRPRAVVAQSPRDWAPERTFLDTVLTGLKDGPIVKPITIDQLFTGTPPAPSSGRNTTPLIRKLADNPVPAELPLNDIRDTRIRLEAFGSMLNPDHLLDDRLEQLLLAAQSLDMRPRERENYLLGVERQIDAELAKLVLPPKRTITLTARRAEIPVSLQWTGDYPIRVRVRLSADRLTFPEGQSARDIELSRRNTTERFVVQARSSGDFPLRIIVEAPEGNLVMAQSRFTVRSTAASGVGIALSVGAGLILAYWWARHLFRGRRNRRLVPA